MAQLAQSSTKLNQLTAFFFTLQRFVFKILKFISLISQQKCIKITLKERLEVFFRRSPYADTFRKVQSFQTKQTRFQDIFYNLDHNRYSHSCSEWVFYVRDFNNEYIAVLYLPIFQP